MCCLQSTLIAIREFVATFFACTDCQKHFAIMSRNIELEVKSKAPVIDGALWLWRAHNQVSRRLAAQAGSKPTDWPSNTECPTCRESGELDDHRTFAYLQAAYREPTTVGHSGAL